jgi:hypothetical protein
MYWATPSRSESNIEFLLASIKVARLLLISPTPLKAILSARYPRTLCHETNVQPEEKTISAEHRGVVAGVASVETAWEVDEAEA